VFKIINKTAIFFSILWVIGCVAVFIYNGFHKQTSDISHIEYEMKHHRDYPSDDKSINDAESKLLNTKLERAKALNIFQVLIDEVKELHSAEVRNLVFGFFLIPIATYVFLLLTAFTCNYLLFWIRDPLAKFQFLFIVFLLPGIFFATASFFIDQQNDLHSKLILPGEYIDSDLLKYTGQINAKGSFISLTNQEKTSDVTTSAIECGEFKEAGSSYCAIETIILNKKTKTLSSETDIFYLDRWDENGLIGVNFNSDNSCLWSVLEMNFADKKAYKYTLPKPQANCKKVDSSYPEKFILADGYDSWKSPESLKETTIYKELTLKQIPSLNYQALYDKFQLKQSSWEKCLKGI